ncbi:hypothetical protein PHSY_000905 [Pseudozyma hubeiensis SY62]|uniref:Proteasome subunit beta n=1 Tax=Pseudozyma hubeiensis (strain SY62) TaxID=1305764 RepID=R9P5J1_PSEHS|nr:hypothetical protein PHSY_000905 [Pseudozyma hubeiensis SY62]GAC93340.1 hypothetical protein PHSY_000905 [Pseudozyma hubeiensis SY62]
MSIMEYNGGSVVAAKGKNCVVIASDLRLGQQAMTVACNFDKVFRVTEKTYVGLPGLASDVATLKERFRYRVNMYKMKEERDIEPEIFANLVSSTLYEKRFGPYFIEPVIAGINSKDEPFIAATDVIGCLNFAKDFVVSGTASDKLFGMAEGLWEPDLVSVLSDGRIMSAVSLEADHPAILFAQSVKCRDRRSFSKRYLRSFSAH